jgi:transposase
MLQATELPIHGAHPNKVREFAKTDKIDAQILKEFARIFELNPDKISLIQNE